MYCCVAGLESILLLVSSVSIWRIVRDILDIGNIMRFTLNMEHYTSYRAWFGSAGYEVVAVTVLLARGLEKKTNEPVR